MIPHISEFNIKSMIKNVEPENSQRYALACEDMFVHGQIQRQRSL